MTRSMPLLLVLSGILVGTAPAQTPAKIPVILDTDLGTDIDDALALALVLASSELELRGVTTVSDDAFTRAVIACRFLEAVGRPDVPVAPGEAGQRGATRPAWRPAPSRTRG